MRNDELKAALKAIEDKEGRLTAEAVVKTATPNDHPLHGQFEWDNNKAGHKFRVQQARSLIKAVLVRVEVDHKIITSIGYVRDPAMVPKQGYRNVMAMRRDPDDAREAVIAEFARVTTHLRRARDLGVVLDLADAIEPLLAEIERLDTVVRETPPPPKRPTKRTRPTA